MIADYEGDPRTLIEDQEAGLYPTLCMRDIVVFPTNMTPIVVGRKESLNLVRMLEHHILCILPEEQRYRISLRRRPLPGRCLRQTHQGYQDAWHRPDEHHHPGSGQMPDETSRSKRALHSN